MPCTTILVGKNASNDRSTMIARTDDGHFDVKKLVVVEPKGQPKKYKSVLSHVEIDLPDNPMRYTACPSVDKKNGIWAATGINAANVGMTATETCAILGMIFVYALLLMIMGRVNKELKEICLLDQIYVKAEDGRVEIVADANWYGVHGGAWTVGNTLLQYVTTAEDPNKNAMLQSYADDAIPTASLGFRFVKDDVADEIAAMENVISEYINPLMCGMVDPDDATHGIAAMQEAMHDAGIDTIMAELQSQYDAWKAAQE